MENKQLEKFKSLRETVKDEELKSNLDKKIKAIESKESILKQ